ncbi:MAG: FAD-binding protein [Polyangiaceae bacterium]
MSKLPRRKLLLGAAAAAVVGFDPARSAWATAPGPGVISIPSLDGEILTDSASLAAAADDFGHIVHNTPVAVLVPGSIDDIVRLVKFAGRHGIKVAAARGLGESHATQGQAQASAGVVIDMSALAEIHEINEHDALVDAGVRWNELLQATLPLGKSPPTLTDFIELSIGGTLSVGGIGGQVHRSGFQVDNVVELEVITGRGQRVTCSASHKADLFNAVRAGLGQFGIIVRARVRLVHVPQMVRVYTATYTDLSMFLADQAMVTDDQRFDYVEGSAAAGATGYSFVIELAKYFDPACPPNDDDLTDDLAFDPGTLASNDVSYFDFANRLAPTIELLKQLGVWGFPHPWLDLFVPGPVAPTFIQAALDSTATADMGFGPILMYPFRRSKVTAPFLAMPSSERVYILDMLRTAIPPIPSKVELLVAANRALFEQVRDLGGKSYAIDSVPKSHADWQDHFGARWPDFAAAKAEYDPDHVLAPGQGIF